MSFKKMSRRDFLRAATNSGLVVAFTASGVPIILAQDATPAPTEVPLPVGEAGKLTVIQKTEYFQEVQELFRDYVTDFAADRGIELDLSTANPECSVTSRPNAGRGAGGYRPIWAITS